MDGRLDTACECPGQQYFRHVVPGDLNSSGGLMIPTSSIIIDESIGYVDQEDTISKVDDVEVSSSNEL